MHTSSNKSNDIVLQASKSNDIVLQAFEMICGEVGKITREQVFLLFWDRMKQKNDLLNAEQSVKRIPNFKRQLTQINRDLVALRILLTLSQEKISMY